MKKLFALLLAVLLLVSCGNVNTTPETTTPAPVEEETPDYYGIAVKNLEESGVALTVDYDVYKNILDALANEEFVAPKNIILIIGDGMGFNICSYTKVVREEVLYYGDFMMTQLPVKGQSATDNIGGTTTDSAAGGTALATGYKTANSHVAVDPTGEIEYQTVLELAASLGKRTGVVATTDLADATPASFTSHIDSRDRKTMIASHQLDRLANGTIDLMIGPGWGYAWSSNTFTKASRETALANGVKILQDWDEIVTAELPFAGYLKKDGDLPIQSGTPTLAEMTNLAISKLDGTDEGFFLMVEGSCIDHAGHSNDFDRAVNEVTEFDKAIAVAMYYVALHPDTILIITADHETGGVTLPENFSAENVAEAKYTTGSHTSADVPVYAIGYGTEALEGENINTDIAKFIAKSMGVEVFGKQD